MPINAPYVFFSCEGTCDTAILAGQIAKFMADKTGGIAIILPGIGAEVSTDMIVKIRRAKKIIILNGCPMCCITSFFDKIASKQKIFVLTITDFNIQKGQIRQSGIDVEKISAKIFGNDKTFAEFQFL